jgi:hypothetical protein
MRSLSRKECPKPNKDDMQPFENTLLFAMTFPKRGLIRKGSEGFAEFAFLEECGYR